MAIEAVWLASVFSELRDLPAEAREWLGYQIHRIQQGRRPENWKPVAGLPGVFEIRVTFPDGIARTLYAVLGKDDKLIAPLVSFIKKTEKTPTRILKLTRERLSLIKNQDTAGTPRQLPTSGMYSQIPLTKPKISNSALT